MPTHPEWWIQLHEEILTIGGYTAIMITITFVVALLTHRHVKITLETNGKDKAKAPRP